MYNDLVEEVDFDLYRVLYIVKKNGSFSKAAEEMNTTQPAVSYKVEKLEEKLGVKLFVRDTRPLKLTSEAKIIMPYIENAVNGIEMGIRRLEEFKPKEHKDVKRGFVRNFIDNVTQADEGCDLKYMQYVDEEDK